MALISVKEARKYLGKELNKQLTNEQLEEIIGILTRTIRYALGGYKCGMQ